MNFQDVLRVGFKDLGDKKLRTALIIMSIVIGIASIIALVSQTIGIQVSVVNTLQNLGPTSIFVTPKTTQGLSYVDVARLSSISGVSTVMPVIRAQATVILLGQTTTITLVGINNDGFETIVGQPKTIDGFFYPDGPAQIVVIGNKVVFPVSGGPQAVFMGQSLQVQIGGRTVTLSVIGLLEAYGNNVHFDTDMSIFMPLDAAARLLNKITFDILIVQAVDIDQVSSVIDILTQYYGNSVAIL